MNPLIVIGGIMLGAKALRRASVGDFEARIARKTQRHENIQAKEAKMLAHRDQKKTYRRAEANELLDDMQERGVLDVLQERSKYAAEQSQERQDLRRERRGISVGAIEPTEDAKMVAEFLIGMLSEY